MIDLVALSVFIVLFVLVTVLGFMASRWRRGDLDLLHEWGMGTLASQAVTLLSCPTPVPGPLLNDLAAHFATRTRAVAVVPYDPALESGSSIEYPDLQPATKKAWLQASAVIMEPFVRRL